MVHPYPPVVSWHLCRLPLSGLLCLALLLGSCKRQETPGTRLPLLQSPHRADVVTESPLLEPPPSLGGNRFVSGWWPWKKEGESLLVSVGNRVRLEGVSLANSTRRLRLEGEVLEAPGDDPIGVLVSGRPLMELPMAFPLDVELPKALPFGRFPIELRLPQNAQIAVRSATFQGTLPAGEVELGGNAIRQTGYSAVDYVLPATAGSFLEVAFEPPLEAWPGQYFEVWIERQDAKPGRVFTWPESTLKRLLGHDRISVPLGEGLVRIRFAALGEGPPGTWRDPTLVVPPKAKQTIEHIDVKPPKLVLVYVMDALRADYVGHLGGPEDASPTLDQLAAEGTTLLDHYSVAPNTFPSIKALFLGRALRYDPGSRVPTDRGTTLAERFRSAGYRTALFTANPFLSETYGTARGFDEISEQAVDFDTGSSGYSDNGERIHRAVLEWLESVPRDQPIFLYIQSLHPHNPYSPPPSLEQHFTAGIDSKISGSTSVLRDIKQSRLKPTPADLDRLRALYTASIRYNDNLIADLLETLEQRYPPAEMLFIATSDHGDELFDHGGVLHGYTLYEEQLHIPAIFWWPGMLPPCRLQTPSDHLDLQMTLRALIEETATEEDSGRSLWPEIQQCTSLTDSNHLRFAAAASVGGGIFMARSGNLKHIWAPRWGQGEGAGRSRDGEYVFDLATDPAELENLAGLPSLRADWLRAQVQGWTERDPARFEEHELVEVDERELSRLKALGYVD